MTWRIPDGVAGTERSETQDPDPGPRTQDPRLSCSPVQSVHLPVQVYFIFFSSFDVLRSH